MVPGKALFPAGGKPFTVLAVFAMKVASGFTTASWDMFGPLSKPSKFVLPWRLPSRVRFHGFAPLGGKPCCDAGEGNRRLRNNTRPASPAETIATNINAATINVKKLLLLVLLLLLPG